MSFLIVIVLIAAFAAPTASFQALLQQVSRHTPNTPNGAPPCSLTIPSLRSVRRVLRPQVPAGTSGTSGPMYRYSKSVAMSQDFRNGAETSESGAVGSETSSTDVPPSLSPSLPPNLPASLAGTLPQDWRMSVDAQSGRTYFWNVKTREVTWFRPLDNNMAAKIDILAGGDTGGGGASASGSGSSTSTSSAAASLPLRGAEEVVEVDAKRAAALRRRTAMMSNVAQREEELAQKHVLRSPTKMLLSKYALLAASSSARPEKAEEDTFASYVRMKTKYSEQPSIDEVDRAAFNAWLSEAYGTEKQLKLDLSLGNCLLLPL